jgi:type IV secretion system protein VirB10
MGFQDFFQKKGGGSPVPPSDTPTGLDLRGPRNAASRMATYVNRRPIYLAGGVVAILILGAAIALDSQKQQGAAPIKVSADVNRKILDSQQLSLEQSARQPAISTAPAASASSPTVSAESSAATEFQSALPPQTTAEPSAPPPQPTQPSPKELALESALKGGFGSGMGTQPSLSSPAPIAATPSDADALREAQAASGVSLPKAQGPASLGDYNAHLLRKPVSPYEITAGSVIPAVLETGIDSDLPGTITALVSRNVYASVSGAYLLIPAGTRLVGTYASSPKMGQNRVFVAWTQLQFPNGTSMDLGGFPGTSPRGYAGFHDLVDDHTWSTFKSALLISLIQTGISLSQPGYGSAGATGTQSVTPSQVAEQNLSNTFGQAEAQMLQSSLNVSPTLKIRPGYTFSVLIPKTLIFPGPYQSVVRPETPDPLPSAMAPLANPYVTGEFPSNGSASGASPSRLDGLLRSLERKTGAGTAPNPSGNFAIGSGEPFPAGGE